MGTKRVRSRERLDLGDNGEKTVGRCNARLYLREEIVREVLAS